MEKIEIPEFVKKINDDSLVNFAKKLSNGEIIMYSMVRDEKNNIIDVKEVLFKDEVINRLSSLKETIKGKEKSSNKCSIIDKSRLKKEISHLKKMYFEILKCPTYLPLLDSEEITEYDEMVELDLAETLGSVKELTMKKTD